MGLLYIKAREFKHEAFIPMRSKGGGAVHGGGGGGRGGGGGGGGAYNINIGAIMHIINEKYSLKAPLRRSDKRVGFWAITGYH